jgi:hypothetical protein
MVDAGWQLVKAAFLVMAGLDLALHSFRKKSRLSDSGEGANFRLAGYPPKRS